jgi:glycerol kinase
MADSSLGSEESKYEQNARSSESTDVDSKKKLVHAIPVHTEKTNALVAGSNARGAVSNIERSTKQDCIPRAGVESTKAVNVKQDATLSRIPKNEVSEENDDDCIVENTMIKTTKAPAGNARVSQIEDATSTAGGLSAAAIAAIATAKEQAQLMLQQQPEVAIDKRSKKLKKSKKESKDPDRKKKREKKSKRKTESAKDC